MQLLLEVVPLEELLTFVQKLLRCIIGPGLDGHLEEAQTLMRAQHWQRLALETQSLQGLRALSLQLKSKAWTSLPMAAARIASVGSEATSGMPRQGNTAFI